MGWLLGVHLIIYLQTHDDDDYVGDDEIDNNENEACFVQTCQCGHPVVKSQMTGITSSLTSLGFFSRLRELSGSYSPSSRTFTITKEIPKINMRGHNQKHMVKFKVIERSSAWKSPSRHLGDISLLLCHHDPEYFQMDFFFSSCYQRGYMVNV